MAVWKRLLHPVGVRSPLSLLWCHMYSLCCYLLLVYAYWSSDYDVEQEIMSEEKHAISLCIVCFCWGNQNRVCFEKTVVMVLTSHAVQSQTSDNILYVEISCLSGTVWPHYDMLLRCMTRWCDTLLYWCGRMVQHKDMEFSLVLTLVEPEPCKTRTWGILCPATHPGTIGWAVSMILETDFNLAVTNNYPHWNYY